MKRAREVEIILNELAKHGVIKVDEKSRLAVEAALKALRAEKYRRLRGKLR